MRETMTDANIPIPDALDSRVGESLRQVRRLHRDRVLRRAGGTLGSLLVVCGVFVTLAAVNPALASQVPLVGRWLGSLFYDANYENKTGTPGAFLETYDVLEEVDTAAQSGQWTVTVLEGYSDGNTVELSLSLTGPQEELNSFSGVDVGSYGQDGGAVVTVNGRRTSAPFVIDAIGDQETMFNALMMRNGVVDVLRQWSIEVEVTEVDDLLIKAYDGTIDYQYAQTLTDDDLAGAETEAG